MKICSKMPNKGEKIVKGTILNGKIKKKKKSKLTSVITNEIKNALQESKIKKNQSTFKHKKHHKKKLERKSKHQPLITNPKDHGSEATNDISNKRMVNSGKNQCSFLHSSKKINTQKKKRKKKNIEKDQKKLENQEIEVDNKPKVSEIIKQNSKELNIPTYSKSKKPIKSLRVRMLEKLQAARFRFINQQIYSSNSKETQKLFLDDPESFHAYHEGYQQQVNKWPLNPLDVMIKSVQQMPKTYVIADFGCGEATLARSVEHKVHSFDLVAKNEFVTTCDMSHVPLEKGTVDVVICCLSLMGTNLNDYILEANRVLKEGGILKVAEVESRFEDVNQFIEDVKKFHFKLIWKDLSHNLFYFLDFKKESNIMNKKKLPSLYLNPCLYKKR